MKPLTFAIISLSVLALDQLTKTFIPLLVAEGPVEILPGLLNLVHVENPGVAFGLMRDLSPSIRLPLLTTASAGAVVVVIYLYIREGRQQMVEGLALSVLLGGVWGNLIDRLGDGRVTDFIDIHLGRYHWPAFNIADTAITTGVALLLLLTLTSPSRSQQRRR